MRTGTKITLAVVVWVMVMATFLIVGIAFLCLRDPDKKFLWDQVPAILTALLGGGGLSFGVNEIRKAIEWTATQKAAAQASAQDEKKEGLE